MLTVWVQLQILSREILMLTAWWWVLQIQIFLVLPAGVLVEEDIMMIMVGGGRGSKTQPYSTGSTCDIAGGVSPMLVVKYTKLRGYAIIVWMKITST
jgi:hypothetical protein